MKTSFMTSPNAGGVGLGLFGNMKVENGLGLFKGDVEKAFHVANELGYDGLEIALADPDEIDLFKLSELVEKYNINIASLATGAIAVKDGLIFTSPDRSIREAAVTRIKKFIDLASIFKSLVVISLVRGGNLTNSGQSKKWIRECLSECAEYCKKKYVNIAFEPINRFQEDFFHSIVDCVNFLKEVNLPNLGILVDSFHMNIEDSDMWGNIRQAGQSIVHVHCADNNRLAPGMGHFDFLKMIKVLKEIDYRGYISAEILPIPDSYTAATQTINSMKSYLN